MGRRPRLVLAKDVTRSIRRGHPWIYDRALKAARAPLTLGEVVEVAYGKRVVAVGFADPSSPIRVRVLQAHGGGDVDEAWVQRTARVAVLLRRRDPRLETTNSIRLLHGEGDYMPGLVIDVYDTTAVAVFDGAGARAFWGPHLRAILDVAREEGITIDRVWGKTGGRGSGECLIGSEPEQRFTVHEDRARFEVDVRRGQKTGLFLDQRENRRIVAGWADGRTVLNLFAYTGGFSVHAALGGARKVTTVDLAGPVVAAARRNFQHSGLNPDKHDFEVTDAFVYLEKAVRHGRTFDLVVCDPPSFAPNERSVDKAKSAYRKLNAAAMRVVGNHGLLATASCSSHIDESAFVETVALAAADVGVVARIIDRRGAATDHPVRPAFPEGRYLSFLLIALG